MRRYIEWVIKHRAGIIVLTALITLGLVFQLKSLSIVLDPAKLLPQSHELVAVGNRVEELFGNKFTVVVGIHAKNGTALTPRVLEKAQRITSAILKSNGAIKSNVVSVSSRKAKSISTNDGGLEVRQLMASVPTTEKGLADLKKALDSNPVYSNLIISKDYSTLAIVAEYKNLGSFRAITGQVEAIIAKEADDAVEITLDGQPVFTAMIEKFSERMGFFFPLALLVISLLLYWAFRSVQALFLPLVTALLAVIWSLGIMGLFKVPLDPFNATTPILILALSAGHAVQIMKRYYEEYHRIRKTFPTIEPRSANRLAVVESVTSVAPVMMSAGLIAATGFFSLLVFDIKTIQTFGVFTGSGILSAMLLEMSFIPALRSMLKAPGKKERRGLRGVGLRQRGYQQPSPRLRRVARPAGGVCRRRRARKGGQRDEGRFLREPQGAEGRRQIQRLDGRRQPHVPSHRGKGGGRDEGAGGFKGDGVHPKGD